MKKYYYHLVSDNIWQVGDKIEIGAKGFGMWNDVYDFVAMNKLDFKTEKDRVIEEYDFIIWELASEEVRQTEFPNLPSRLRCLWLCEDIKDCEKRVQEFRRLGRTVSQIVKVELDGNILNVNPENLPKSKKSYNQYKECARKFFTDNEKRENSVIMFTGILTVVEVYNI